ncbi:glycogen/starch synthase [Candidatus Woesearchaeota archaeon]|nr:glycogen/starch synthase [Candidatus Woesearchaeota archaeon]
MTETKPDLVFESSWEVCNKVGGIHTVITSKAPLMDENYKRYFLIGPYFDEKAKRDFSASKIPDGWGDVFKKLEEKGIKAYFGKWEIKGEPKVILIDYKNLIDKRNEMKKKLWENFKIDTLFSKMEFDEPMVWSYCVSELLSLIEQKEKNNKIVGHFHEWMAGLTSLFLKIKKSNIKTVFTTHATMLGRTLAGSGFDLYNNLQNIDPEKEARQRGLIEKFTTEKACANESDVFTTISEITKKEAKHFLGKDADILLPNGLDMERFPTMEENSIKHITCRKILREFISYYFFPYNTFQLDHNLIYYFLGRNEFKNKGADITIKALGKLNDQLKKDKSKRTVTFFFWIPLENKGIKSEIRENKDYYYHIKRNVETNSEDILKRIIYDFVSQRDFGNESLFTKDFLMGIKKDIIAFKRKGNPPLCTHIIENEDNNEIIKLLREVGLDNKEDDKVKVILNPVYLNGNDGLFDLEYYDAMAGCHLGLFPSYYEPWGYTPLESISMSVPAVTSDLAGFGKFIEDKASGKTPGIYVLKREKKEEKDMIMELFKIMYKYAIISHPERVDNKMNAKKVSMLADWNEMVKYYFAAHALAVKKR